MVKVKINTLIMLIMIITAVNIILADTKKDEDIYMWVEAESFKGWGKAQREEPDLSGGWMLVGNIDSIPAEKITVLPNDGLYRIWVRMINSQKSSRRGKVEINGIMSKIIGGEGTSMWKWFNIGEFTGPLLHIRLYGMDTGLADALYDTLLITTDLSYTPPDVIPPFGSFDYKKYVSPGIPKVAVVYSSYKRDRFSSETDYDLVLNELGWLYDKYQNTQIGILKDKLPKYDIILLSTLYNYNNSVSFEKYSKDFIDFIEKGGALIVTDANLTQQTEWFNTLGESFSIKIGDCKEGLPVWFNINHPLMTTPYDLSKIPFHDFPYAYCRYPNPEYPKPIWKHFSQWANNWSVDMKDKESNPLLLTQEYNTGIVVVTNLFSGWGFTKEYLSNIWSYLLGKRHYYLLEKMSFSTLKESKKSLFDVKIKNTSDSYQKIGMKVELISNFGKSFSGVKTADLQGGQSKTISFEYPISETGKQVFSFTMFNPQGQEIYYCAFREKWELGKDEEVTLSRNEFDKPPKSYEGTSITINKENALLLNDIPFFPFGLYNVLKENLKLVSEVGFNTIYYAGMLEQTNGQAYLDEADRYGLKVITSISWTWDDNILKEKLSKCQNHPALLTYYVIDEPSNQTFSRAQVTEKNDRVKEIDPYHPTFIVHNDELAFATFSRIADIDILNPYCIGATHSSLTHVTTSIDKFKNITGDKKPIWVILQAHQYTPYLIYPSPEQERAMTYLSIIHGAKGIIYFIFDHPEMGIHKKDTFQEPLWTGLKQISHQIKVLQPVILSPTPLQRVTITPQNSQVHFITKEYKEHKYILAVNPLSSPTKVTFNLEEHQDTSKIEVMFEDRSVVAKDRSISDDFQPYGVHIYKIGE